MWSPRRCLAVALSLVAGWGVSSAARACSQAVCIDGLVAPVGGTSIPANQTTLVVRAASPIAGAAVDPQPGSNLRLESAGTPVAFSIERMGSSRYWLLRPDRLSAGASYTLSYAFDCGRGPTTRTSTFTVGDAAPPAITAGELKLDASGEEPAMEPPAGTSCSINYRHAWATFAFVPSPEVRPFLPVARLLARVDGNFWSEVPYGQVASEGGVALSASCEPDKPSVEPELTPGKHLLEVTVEIAGGPSLALPPREVELSCAQQPAPADAGADSGPGGSSSGSGCSLGAAGGGAPALVLALAVLVLRRGRRR
jgi:hypothetical protein